jgi:hypothetical protein
MKKSLVVLAVLVLGLVFTQSVFAQVDQTVNFSVAAVAKLAVSGNSITLAINDGTAGTSALTAVSDNATSYSLVNNKIQKITAGLNSNMPANTSLVINLADGNGSSQGDVTLTSGAQTVVDNIARGAMSGGTITYTLNADATAGVITSTSRTVTLTLTD